jgi:sigma-54 specific flagellar transcriptional regulator A
MLGEMGRKAFANPFGERVAPVDAAGLRSGVDALEKAGAADLRLYAGDDRAAVLMAFLADAYLRYADALDGFIDEQAGSASAAEVPFAGELLRLLQRRGCTADASLHVLAIFYQMRRARRFVGEGIIGSAPSVLELKRRLWNNLFTSDITAYERTLWQRMNEFPTLLLGEPGSGRSTAAAALARSGYVAYDPQRNIFVRPFASCLVSLHAGRLGNDELRLQLFGPEGALARSGPGGTVWLDGVDALDDAAQAQLLHTLDRGPGATRFEGRLVAGLSASPETLRDSGRLRDDLYYRLAADAIPLPPLRQRFEERIAERRDLLGSIVHQLTGRPSPSLADQVDQALDRQPGRHYPWPGNMLELEQAARRIILHGAYDGDRASIATDQLTRLVESIRAGTLAADDLLAAYCQVLHKRHGTYEAVADITQLDRRTAKKYVLRGSGK